MAQTYFASIQPGLEEPLLAEIRRLGGKRPRQVHGGVEFDAARKTLYAAHLQLRTPTRIWMRVDEFRARDAPELYRKCRRFEWERLIGGEHNVAVRAYSWKSGLYHTGKIADAVTGALGDRFQKDIKAEKAPTFVDESHRNAQLILVRIAEDRCQVSLDASGDLLHMRGWRKEAGDAPLRESIAAAVLEAIDWNGDQGLFDPFCGSGTIPIEAAHRALGRPPGLDRRFSFQRWRNFERAQFEEQSRKLQGKILQSLPAPIYGHDKDVEVLERARRNAERAGVGSLVRFEERKLVDRLPDESSAWIVTNPPYGARLEKGGALDALLSAWIPVAKERKLAFLWPRDARDQIPKRTKLLSPLLSFDNGGLAVDLWSS